MKRKVLFAFLPLFLLICLLFPLTASASDRPVPPGTTPAFHDDGYLSAADRERVLSALTEAQEKTGFHYGVLIYNSEYDGGSVHNRMKEEDSVLLIIWQESTIYRYEMFTYGKAYDELTDREVDDILGAVPVYDNIKGGRFADGICAFASLSAEAAIPDPNAEAKHTVRTLLISAVLALTAAGAVAGTVVYQYKKKLKAPIYPLDRFARMKLVDQGDTFITAHVTRVRVSSPSSNSSGGRSGGGGGGSRGSR